VQRLNSNLLDGDHDISQVIQLKLALYTDSATLDANTQSAYSATNEVGGSGSYSAGGGTLAKCKR
jgi:hypothetical protein